MWWYDVVLGSWIEIESEGVTCIFNILFICTFICLRYRPERIFRIFQYDYQSLILLEYHQKNRIFSIQPPLSGPPYHSSLTPSPLFFSPLIIFSFYLHSCSKNKTYINLQMYKEWKYKKFFPSTIVFHLRIQNSVQKIYLFLLYMSFHIYYIYLSFHIFYII